MSAVLPSGRSECTGVDAKKRIGIFGGAFDPPHKAHVALAQLALDQLALDELHVIPTGSAWHKARALSSATHRLAMTQLAFQGMPRVLVDDRELQRAGPTFTVDTLEALQAENPSAQLYLFMGSDQFAAFKQWHRWQAILELAIICIADRTLSAAPQAQFDAYQAQKTRFLQLLTPLMPVSATQIRQLLASGVGKTRDISDLVSEPVARYIAVNRVYSPR